jgi:nitroreductase
MQLEEAVEQRRSVKHYDPAHKLTKEEIQKLFSLAILSPTSFNIQNWRFLIIDDTEQRKLLQAAAWNQAQVTEASLLVLICADLKAYAKDPQRYWINAEEAVRNNLVPMIGNFYEGREEVQRDEAMRSVGIAGQTLMLTAKAMGYDSCPMIGFDPVKVAEIIELPKDHVVGMMLTIGKAKEPARPRGGQLALQEVLFYNRF